ncbi:hypothetical protein JTB14_002598 [Gonioctena quinquepunctata]|nr:hypothetical protein JTB14_002598 [Gonioctena quinquepunctata]
MNPDYSHSRNSSASGSFASEKSSRYLNGPRRNVGDKVLITSLSKVYVNHNGSDGATALDNFNEENCDNDRDYEMVGQYIRHSKDLPKFKNRIFEDSLESQEISFYIADDKEEEEAPDYENVSYDSFDTDSDSEFHNVDEVTLRKDIADNPLPPEPISENKFTRNLRKFKKNFSRDITKSLRRISKRMSLAEPDTGAYVPEESPAPVVHSKEVKSEADPGEESQKSEGLLTKIRRSVSISAISVANLTNYFDNPQDRRKSTFYCTDTIDIDENEDVKRNDETIVEHNEDTVSSNRSSLTSQAKSKVVRPKMPPPPVPVEYSGIIKSPTDCENRKSLYLEAGLFKKNNFQNKQNTRTSWYAEIGLYPKSLSINDDTTVEKDAIINVGKTEVIEGTNLSKNPMFSSVIEELNLKLNKPDCFENENTYNNQSVSSFGSTDSKKDGSSITYAANDLKFLEDEPLYQFYDPTSISDCDTDFENDIYEDMEETNENYISSTPVPQVTSTNLNFNFTRSLWCETPEVINSAVLGKLSLQQRKLQEAKFEIITSEASQRKRYERTLWESTRSERHVEKNNERSRKMLAKNILLDGICDIIQRHAEENFHVYIPYCENQVTISDTLNRMKEQSGFVELLTQLESSTVCQFLTLYSFLMLPMQRVTRWPLLVDAILKRLSESDPEYLKCQYSLAALNKIAGQCNEAARKKEQEIELKRISESLEFPNGVPTINLQRSERWLIKSGAVTSLQPRNSDSQMTLGKRFNKIPLNLFLFSDLFIVTRKKSERCYTVLHYCPRSMIELRTVGSFPTILKKEAQDKKLNLLYLSILENQEGKIIELLFCSSTESDRERWMEAFSPPKSENPDETVYECWDCPQMKALHNYNACQPDELSLSKGDVINVLRKMNDGWYHGERLRDGKTGWFPANYTIEIVNPHVRARNLRQKYRLLAFSENYLNS